MPTLKLILGDQLNPQHSWFAKPSEAVIFVLMEIRQETDYVLHHAQKIIAIFAAMRDFAAQLQAAGHRVHYLKIDDPDNQHQLTQNLSALIAHYRVRAVCYQEPDEYRLDSQLAEYAQGLSVPMRCVSSEHFYTERDEAAQLFAGRKSWLMETFYRAMRVKHGVLIDAQQQPIGGQWNFDHDNRKPWRGVPFEPQDVRVRHDHSALWASITAAGVKSFGAPNAARFVWPLNREEALQHLADFIEQGLPYFGDFQDAMSSTASRLFHSQLSFALNVKMLSPVEVVNAVVEATAQDESIALAACEGFVRQILGWREYVRGVYWANMPGYDEHNFFAHQRALPTWFWTGKTRLRCMANALDNSLQNAHAHHIQRLMVIGNFALLAGLNPKALHHWYLGVYIDAFEWVELPNTLGMSQFADGGKLATKPYVSAAAYIDRMSDYCAGCHYDKKLRIGAKACPFNALYWDFFARNSDKLARNPRIGMVYPQLKKMEGSALVALQAQAATWRENLDAL
ncbi:MAG: cryptochrome/photolyase family protein [Gallionella sp.]